MTFAWWIRHAFTRVVHTHDAHWHVCGAYPELLDDLELAVGIPALTIAYL